MLKRLMRCISAVLVLVLVLNMVPVQALELVNNDPSIVESVNTEDEDKIVAELSAQRDTYTKQFLLDNGNKMAVQYAIPVHYQDSDGIWQQYDNRMTEIEAVAADATATDNPEAEFRVIQSDKDIRLAKKASEKKLVTIEKDGHQISWGFTGINKVDVVFTEEDTIYEGNDAFLTLEGIIQEARYDGAFPNADLQYYILPTGVKENIILKNADAQNEFEMEYKFHKLTATQTDSRHITLSDEDGNPVYTITAPTMCDANGVWSNELTLTIVEAKNNKLTVKLTADAQWLQDDERSFPVTVDPSFETAQTWGSLDSSTLVSGHPDTSYGYNGDSYIGSLYAGYEINSSFRKTRSLVRLNTLPQLSPGDVIVDAQLCLAQLASYKSIQVNAHQVTADWDMATATWNSMSSNYNPIIEDYHITTYSTRRIENDWDVTDLVRKWYDGTAENYGVMLIAPTETSTSMSRVIYFSSTYPDASSTRPVFQITFRNHNGLEEYWDYTASSAGRAGTGYVNSYTGNLVWTRADMGFGGNRGPVTITHTYNANDTKENLFGMGYGWRTNFNQRVYNWSQDSSYYIWEDEDGTDHYFKRVSSGTYKDEDGLELTLTNTGSGTEKFVITNKNGGKTYFDANGRLTKISNNQKAVTNVVVSYKTSDGLQIETVTDGVKRVYAFTYNTDGLLSHLAFKGTGDTELTYIDYGYTNGLLTSITDKDNKSVSYTYDPNYKFLSEVQDIDGYKIVYEYDHFSNGKPSRITKVQEFDGTVAGGELSISYNHNETTFIDKQGNKQILQFNNWGNTRSVQDGEGRAQFATYAQDEASGGKGNQLRLASKLQNTVRNLFADNSFEEGTAWTSSTGTAGVSSQNAYIGTKSLSATGQAVLNGGSYTVAAKASITFSGWVKTVSGTAKLEISANGAAQYSEELSGATDWTRLQVSYTNNGDQAITIQPLFCGTGEAYLDCVQLEYMPTASRFNLLNNGDFQYDGQWTPTNSETGDGRSTVANSAPKLDSTAYAITGNALKQKNIYQTVQVSGTEGDSFVLGGWAMGDAVAMPDDSDRAFGLYAIFHYTDGTESERMSAKFNPDADGWQYTAAAVVAEKDYSSVDIYVCYDFGVNTVYFDGIQLFKEKFGSTYTYDPETGDVISVVDLQNKRTEYEYDTDGNLTQIIQDDNVEMTYTYDAWHNVETATTKEGYVYTFVYDKYGNNTSVSITEKTENEVKKTMTSSATYTENGDFMVSATDALGNVTTYSYNLQTGLLEWVQFPEDTAATKTQYGYDEMYNMETITAQLYRGETDTNLDMSVRYTYTDDLLSAITTPTTTYNFECGKFSLRESVWIGTDAESENRYILATYDYDDKNRLEILDYGNGDKVEYSYDPQGRLIQEKYKDNQTVTYQYDNCGNVATVTDSETGIVTTYYYDLLNRNVGYREQGPNLDHSVTYIYDAENNLSSMTEVINGVSKTYTYTYNEDNRLTSMTVDGVTVEYTYDGFGRLSEQVTKQGNTEILTEQTGYNDTATTASTQVTSYNGYTYTYDDNGNILSVSDGTNTTTYVYDSQNQLIRENNQAQNYTHTWTYDNAGNIQSRKEYTYTLVENLDNVTLTDTVSYGYNDDKGWGDLLTSYDGRTITYDKNGNPLNDGEWTYNWKHGRQLVSMSDGTTTWNYTYNADNLRSKRTNGTYTYSYVYSGSLLAMMTVGENTLHFTYDVTGTPLSVKHNGTTYYYKTNLQGDVIGIVDSCGTAVVTYAYNAWGVLLNVSGTMKDTLGAVNPLTYRGYVYDRETGLYYLQSRYYDPELGRFINADVFVATGQGFVGNNMFAYCLNNPVSRVDISGCASEVAVAIKALLEHAKICAAKALINGLTSAISSAVMGGSIEEIIESFISSFAIKFVAEFLGPGEVIVYTASAVYTAISCYQKTGNIGKSIVLGCVDFVCSYAGIKIDDLAVQLFVDFVFGLAADLISEALEKAIENSAHTTIANTSTSTYHPQNSVSSPSYTPSDWRPSYTGFGHMYILKIRNPNYSIPITNNNLRLA